MQNLLRLTTAGGLALMVIAAVGLVASAPPPAGRAAASGDPLRASSEREVADAEQMLARIDRAARDASEQPDPQRLVCLMQARRRLAAALAGAHAQLDELVSATAGERVVQRLHAADRVRALGREAVAIDAQAMACEGER
jgi:hypothetical protein